MQQNPIENSAFFFNLMCLSAHSSAPIYNSQITDFSKTISLRLFVRFLVDFVVVALVSVAVALCRLFIYSFVIYSSLVLSASLTRLLIFVCWFFDNYFCEAQQQHKQWNSSIVYCLLLHRVLLRFSFFYISRFLSFCDRFRSLRIFWIGSLLSFRSIELFNFQFFDFLYFFLRSFRSLRSLFSVLENNNGHGQCLFITRWDTLVAVLFIAFDCVQCSGSGCTKYTQRMNSHSVSFRLFFPVSLRCCCTICSSANLLALSTYWPHVRVLRLFVCRLNSTVCLFHFTFSVFVSLQFASSSSTSSS